MENISVQKRDLAVKAKKVRSLGMVTGSVIGKSLSESISIQMEETVARKLLRQKREGSKIVLNIDGQVILVQIKEKTMNTLNNQILDITFQALTSDEKVNSVIHVLLANDDIVVGQLEKMLLEIPYASLPEDMIDTITLDLDGIKMGTTITVKDIPELMSDKIELQVDLDETILRLREKRKNVATQTEE
ncbi:MAG TPA: 50S ribosomal protein L25/general stress protein Ctc [Lachnospiraceae bacterium]|nr:50S ribosomal protein L25/general stress protein Ctc [Lachnospiraceae bacterium]